VIAKVTNGSADPVEAKLNLNGAENLTGEGSATVVTSENPSDENTLDDPKRVSPRTETIGLTGDSLTRAFSGNSFTVLRLKTSIGVQSHQ